MNVIGTHNLTGSDTIRRCGFVGMGMGLLAEVCHCVAGLRFPIRRILPSMSADFLMPFRCRYLLLSQHYACLHATMLPIMMDTG